MMDFLDLPEDIHREILSWIVKPNEIIKCCLVNHYFKKIIPKSIKVLYDKSSYMNSHWLTYLPFLEHVHDNLIFRVVSDTIIPRNLKKFNLYADDEQTLIFILRPILISNCNSFNGYLIRIIFKDEIYIIQNDQILIFPDDDGYYISIFAQLNVEFNNKNSNKVSLRLYNMSYNIYKTDGSIKNCRGDFYNEWFQNNSLYPNESFKELCRDLRNYLMEYNMDLYDYIKSYRLTGYVSDLMSVILFYLKSLGIDYTKPLTKNSRSYLILSQYINLDETKSIIHYDHMKQIEEKFIDNDYEIYTHLYLKEPSVLELISDDFQRIGCFICPECWSKRCEYKYLGSEEPRIRICSDCLYEWTIF